MPLPGPRRTGEWAEDHPEQMAVEAANVEQLAQAIFDDIWNGADETFAPWSDKDKVFYAKVTLAVRAKQEDEYDLEYGTEATAYPDIFVPYATATGIFAILTNTIQKLDFAGNVVWTNSSIYQKSS